MRLIIYTLLIRQTNYTCITMGISMQQRTEEWLAMRKKHITSTDASAIIGVCPWRTPYQLWLDKLDMLPPKEVTAAMQHGTDSEPIALRIFNDMSGLNMVPIVKIKGFQMASLDGYDPINNQFIEIKCPYTNRDDHIDAVNGEIPLKHHPQIAHQFLVTGAERAWFCSYFDKQATFFCVERDNVFSNDYMLRLYEEEAKFYEYMKNCVEPPMTSKDYVIRNDKEFMDVAEGWKTHAKLAAHHEDMKEIYREKLKSLCHNANARGSGVRVSKSITRGRVDYDLIPEIKNIDLEQYRSPHRETWRIMQEKD